MEFKGAIFDLDGTLLDTLEDLADSFNYALRSFNFPEHPVNSYKFFVGDGAKDAVTRALPVDKRDEKTVEKTLNLFSEHYSKNYNNKTGPYTGMIELLENLKSRAVKLAVLSNKPHHFTLQCVEFYFNDQFDLVMGAGRFPKKPDPQSALYILKELQIEKSEVVYVGDTKTDMQTAKAAGLPAVGVTWGFRDEAELKETGADYIINHPAELLKI